MKVEENSTVAFAAAEEERELVARLLRQNLRDRLDRAELLVPQPNDDDLHYRKSRHRCPNSFLDTLLFRLEKYIFVVRRKMYVK